MRASRSPIRTLLFILNEDYVFRRTSRRSPLTGLRLPRDNARIPKYLKLFLVERRVVIVAVLSLRYIACCEARSEEVSEGLQLFSEPLDFLIQF